MKATIIGFGSVGQALARNLASHGVTVTIGVRDPGDIESNFEVATPAESVVGADFVFLAVPGHVVRDVVEGLGTLGGKTIVDCTNPLRFDGGPIWSPPEEGSNAALIKSLAPDARVVKSFNSFGAEFHENADLNGPVDLFWAGEDPDGEFVALAEQLGYRPIFSGPLRNASVLENVAVHWIHLALVEGHGRNWVFRVDQ